MKYLACATVLVVCAGAWGLDTSDSRLYECTAGNCRDGVGTVVDLFTNTRISGNWHGRQTIPGETYRASHPQLPDKSFEQVYGPDGFLKTGVMFRPIGSMSKRVSYFSGRFTSIENPFLKARISVPREGSYFDVTGMEYRGQFEYLPAKGRHAGYEAVGYFIFYGEQIDPEEETKVTGLFISDATYAGAQIRFVKATPSYMEHMQALYQRDLGIASDEARSKQSWATLFSVLGQVALAYSGAGGNLLSSQDRDSFAVTLIKEALDPDQKPLSERSLTDLALGVAGRVVNQKTGGSGLSTEELIDTKLDAKLGRRNAAALKVLTEAIQKAEETPAP